MGRLALLTVLALALAGCGGSPRPKTAQIEFGILGGNIAPYTVTIARSGDVRASGTQTSAAHVSTAVVASFSQFPPGLVSRQCPGTLPDIASEFVRVGGRTIRVHGACERPFNQFFMRLVKAVGLTTR